MAEKFVSLGGKWQSQVYNEKGEHVGFFETDEDATKWIAGRPFKISAERPHRGMKPGVKRPEPEAKPAPLMPLGQVSHEYPYGKGNQGPGTGPDGERLI